MIKKTIVFALSFILIFLVGAAADLLNGQLYYHAETLFCGRPLPPLTKWVFEHFSQGSYAGILCLFILPWALFLLWTVWSRTVKRDSWLFGFACLAAIEMILLALFALSTALPFIPVRQSLVGGGSPMLRDVPLTNYLPAWLLLVVIVMAAIASSIRFFQRLRKKSASAEE